MPRSRSSHDLLAALLVVLGIVAVVVGVALVSTPAAFITGGILAVGLAYVVRYLNVGTS